MQVKEVSFQRVVNIGNYESIRLGVIADIAPDESPERALNELRAFLDGYIEDITGPKDILLHKRPKRGLRFPEAER